jgi:hypothetical protein
MTQLFKISVFASAVFLTTASLGGSFLSAAPSRETEQNSEGMEMIARQMRSLSQSLDQMPGPPAFDQTLQIPGEPLEAPAAQKNHENFQDQTEDKHE